MNGHKVHVHVHASASVILIWGVPVVNYYSIITGIFVHSDLE